MGVYSKLYYNFSFRRSEETNSTITGLFWVFGMGRVAREGRGRRWWGRGEEERRRGEGRSGGTGRRNRGKGKGRKKKKRKKSSVAASTIVRKSVG